jgi:hypothetical protein
LVADREVVDADETNAEIDEVTGAGAVEAERKRA